MKPILSITRSLAFALPFVGLVADVANAEEAEIQEILVTAKAALPIQDVLATAHVLTLSDIEALQAQDLPQLLDQLSGVNVRDSGGRGSVTDVFVRGTSNTQLIVLIDGVRVGSATLGAAALNTYPIEAIERIELIKGPLAGIYGADAVGGVIQIFTKKGRTGDRSAFITVGDDALLEVGLGWQGGNETVSYHLSFQGEETDGIDRTSIQTGGNADTDGYEETAYSLGVNWNISDQSALDLSVLYSDNETDIDNTFGADIGDFSTTETLSAALKFQTSLSDQATWTVTAGMNEDESTTFSAFPSAFKTERDSLGTDVIWSLSEATTVTVGADYYQENIESSTDYPIDERDNSAVFGLLHSQLGPFGVLASMRYDDNSAYGSDTNTSLALDVALNDTTELVLSYGTAFVAPSFNFLYFPFFGNPDLKPEESESLELTLRGQSDNVGWRVSTFDTQVENLFSFDPATFLAANVGTAELRGMEFEANIDLNEWKLAASIDLLSAENKQTGAKLDDRAEHTVRLSAAREYERFGVRFGVKGESNRFDSGGQELNGHVLFDVSGHYQFTDSVSLKARIDNLFDQDYTVNLIGLSERYRTPGRQAKVTLRVAF